MKLETQERIDEVREETRGSVVDLFESKMFKVKNRVRGGGTTVQRKKRVSAKKGWTYDSKTKKSTKIDAVDRVKMSKTSKRSAIKAKSKKCIAGLKRKKSNRKRKALGFDK